MFIFVIISYRVMYARSLFTTFLVLPPMDICRLAKGYRVSSRISSETRIGLLICGEGSATKLIAQ